MNEDFSVGKPKKLNVTSAQHTGCCDLYMVYNHLKPTKGKEVEDDQTE